MLGRGMSEIERNIWSDDLLGRQAEADFLLAFLTGRMKERQQAGIRGSYVLNLEAEWGFGKTFFMTHLAEEIEQRNHPVIYIDAWKNDFSEDPYTNVIAEIEAYFQKFVDQEKSNAGNIAKAYDAVKKNAGKIFWIGLKGGLKRGSRWLIAEGADEIIEVVDKHVIETGDSGKSVSDEIEKQAIKVTDKIIDAFAQKRIDEFQEAKISLERFRESLSALLKAVEETTATSLPLFVLIDELDRCRPTYAITMLERIKHLFDVDNVVFLLSTDTTQLAHSINGVYGQSFDSKRYLRRFFSRTYLLPKPSPRGLIDALIEASGIDEDKWQAPGKANDKRGFLAGASTRLGMSMRDIEQAVDILFSLTTMWPYPFPIQLLVMYPLIEGYLSAINIDDLRPGEAFDARLGEKFKSWSIVDAGNFRDYGKFSQRHAIKVYWNNLMEKASSTREEFYNRQGQTRMSSLSERKTPDYLPIWVDEVLMKEYGVRTGREAEGHSIIVNYVDLIRSAGRLSQ